ncbi:hypothetical protein BTA51_16585 [Hahella sp. CCB-MM4]|uniref:hypothetical protein n=1 Tax=Hahella sp. (strain CCB-MM4) TaxID=1926491 RepID=UPI000B9A5354|nr:hypothetical protein [Hahella sp. CCB-MM4]OZG72346.1 hypothetical protein BTA51_16585 [Hahella sp. CCB-MM4]
MKRFQIDLAESELKIVLEALTKLEHHMSTICAESDDEDEIADIGNDLIEVRLLLKPLRERAIKQFGEGIVNFSRESM